MSGATDNLRRGWCPSVLRPMETGDGLLVRLHPRAARLTSAQAHAVAAGARACGNGLIDLSSRGNLQVRGVGPETQARLVGLLSEAGLDDAARPRACIVSPLAGIDSSDLIDAVHLADEIEGALGAVEAVKDLPAKFSVVVDGGGLPLDDVEADVRLVASEVGRLAVAIAASDGPVWIGACAPGDAPAAVRSIAGAFCNAIRDGSPARRIRDLCREARHRIGVAATLAPCRPPPARPPRPHVGSMPLGTDSLAVGLGLSFGRLDTNLLDRLADWSLRFGVGELRLSPWRAVFVPDVVPASGPELLVLGREAGFILDEEEPRRAIAACPGAPSCGRASVATHADATRLAAEAHRVLHGATVHVSGCAKGCARRATADFTLVGEGGRYGVVIRGDVRQPPRAYMGIHGIVKRLRALDAEGPLALLSTERLARAFEDT